MLYQRNMFHLAIELAQSSGMDAQQQTIIYRKFGDHLYQKADYDGAMVQYIRAIDTTEPSQVIRKVCRTSLSLFYPWWQYVSVILWESAYLSTSMRRSKLT